MRVALALAVLLTVLLYLFAPGDGCPRCGCWDRVEYTTSKPFETELSYGLVQDLGACPACEHVWALGDPRPAKNEGREAQIWNWDRTD